MSVKDEIELRLEDIIDVIKHNFKIIVIFFIASIFIATLIILVSKPIYLAKAKIIAEKKEKPSVFTTKDSYIDDRTISTYISLIKNSSIIKDALLNIETAGSQKSVSKVLESLKVKRIPDEFSWEIEYLSSVSAKDAEEVLRSVIESYLKYISNFSQNVLSSNAFIYKQQIDEIKSEMNELEKKIKNFQEKNKIVDFSKQKESLSQTLVNLENEKFDVEKDIIEKENELSNIKKKLVEFGVISDEKTKIDNNLRIKILSLPLMEKELLEKSLKLEIELNSLEAKKNTILSRLEELKDQIKQLPNSEFDFISLQREYALKEQAYRNLTQRYSDSLLSSISQNIDIRLVEPPIAKPKPIAPKKKMIFLLCPFVGFLSSLVVILVKMSIKNPFISVDQVTDELKLPVLAKFPKTVALQGENIIQKLAELKDEKEEVLREYLENNITNFFISYNFNFPITFGITSVVPYEGKTTISTLLSSYFAMKGKKTLFIDFDVYKLKGIKIFNLNGSSDRQIVSYNRIKNLYILNPLIHNNGNNSNALIECVEFIKNNIENYKKNFDVIVLDTFPEVVSGKTHIFKELNFDLVYIVNLFSTPKDLLKESIEKSIKADVKVRGIILNRLDSIKEYYSYYKYYSSYYSKNK